MGPAWHATGGRSPIQVPRPREAEDAEAGEAQADRGEQHRAERLLEHLGECLVKAARLVRLVGDGGVTEQGAGSGELSKYGELAWCRRGPRIRPVIVELFR
jgi:hypothetical protein